jgi:membrane-associated phospholipid phosphatase
VKPVRLKSVFALALLVTVLPGPAHAKGEKTWDTASSIGAYGLTAVAIGFPLVRNDTNGALQAAGSFAAAQLVTFGLKEAFPELRPDGSDRKSFPSGHTSTAFAAASSLFNRQGQSVGIPALAVATFVGLARVQADKHHWYDVVVGAAIGSASGFLITRDRPDRAALIVPWGDTKGAGVALARDATAELGVADMVPRPPFLSHAAFVLLIVVALVWL